MAASIKLGQDVVWGTSTAGTLAQGKILSLSKKSGSKLFEQEDENGETYSVIYYDPTTEVQVEVLVKSAATIPAPGDVVTVAGVTDMLVLDSEQKWQAGQTKKLALNLKKWTA